MQVGEVTEIDSWLETLFQCKQLDEETVKKLCDKVKYNTAPFSLIPIGP